MLPKKFRIAVFVWVVLILIISAPARPGFAADGDIVISEVVYTPTCLGTTESTCGTSGTTETRFEWVELYNQGAVAVSLNGWQICDNTSCDPLPDAEIGPGEHWIVAYSETALQTEFDQYTPAFTVNSERTLTLNSPIGNGLANSADQVYLLNADPTPLAVDCISWDSSAGTACSALTYVAGRSGFDTDLDGAQDGQSITNVQGTWYEHGYEDAPLKASPYAINTAVSGPTAIQLAAFTARSQAGAAYLGLITLLLSGLVIFSLRPRPQR